MTKEIASIHETYKEEEPFNTHSFTQVFFDKVSYWYGSNDDQYSFRVGPITMEINSGEIVFVSGGNGSGKSTFVKLLTGLYYPTAGSIGLNGKQVTCEEIQLYRDLYSPIYTDNHLFSRLYGQTSIDSARVNELIEKLGLKGKVNFSDKAYSTINLSQGQKKRLALISALIEDKPIYVFDEWAANQDTEFKEFFYRQLLQELSSAGKAVIVITHDDRYFDVADKHFRMENGKLTKFTTLASHISYTTE